MSQKDELLKKLNEMILQGNSEKAVETSQRCLEVGLSPLQIIIDGCNKAMKIAGDLYEKQEYYVPELLLCAEAMESVVSYLKPHIESVGSDISGTVVLGVVAGDIHSIGKNLVKLLLESYGLKVVDLGEDVFSEAFIEAAKTNAADIIGISTLMTTTMDYMEQIIKDIKEQGLNVITIVGGAPVNEEFKTRIGADAFYPDANKAAKGVQDMLRKRKK